MQDDLYALFQRNFPFTVREGAVARNILHHESNHIIEKRHGGQLIAAAVINGNAISRSMACAKPIWATPIPLSTAFMAGRDTGFAPIT